VEAAWGATARARCVACHQPGFGGDDAIGCVACHAAIGNRGEANGALVVDLEAPLASRSLARTLEPHALAPRGLLRSASLCGTCHEVHGPGLLDEPTLSELRAADPQADDCLGCHAGASTHQLRGVDADWGARAAGAQETTQKLWAQAFTLSLEARGATATLRLENSGTGHAVPTGVSALREVWVDLEARDADGVRVQLPRVMVLGARAEREGREVPLLTDASHLVARSLAPRQVLTLDWSAPPTLRAPLTLTATLRARALRSDTLAALGLSALDAQVPTHEVATAQVELSH
jgi:hypothetical protein